MTMHDIEEELTFLNLTNGGNLDTRVVSHKSQSSSHKNKPNEKVAIIVPYRNRIGNLKSFIRYMHQFLAKQIVDYTIFLVEPAANLTFNRGLLINIGYLESVKLNAYDCFIFHDVDMLPENENNVYTCSYEKPRQMAIHISIYNYAYAFNAYLLLERLWFLANILIVSLI